MAVYVAVSLATCREDFNLERMLHRGPCAKIEEEVGDTVQQPATRKLSWTRLFGIDENFTRGDKWIAGFLFSWSSLFSAIFVVGTLWNFVSPWSLDAWAEYWHVTSIVIPVFFAVVFGVWFMWGGGSDTRHLFRESRNRRVNVLDNGMVIDRQNLDESVLPDTASPMATDRKSASGGERAARPPAAFGEPAAKPWAFLPPRGGPPPLTTRPENGNITRLSAFPVRGLRGHCFLIP